MVALIFFLLNLVTSPFKPKSRLEAENAALRHQVMVLQRKVSGRVQFTNSDRLFFIQLYRWCPSVLKAMIILQPETVVRDKPIAAGSPWQNGVRGEIDRHDPTGMSRPYDLFRGGAP